jgi:hypothetical protein
MRDQIHLFSLAVAALALCGCAAEKTQDRVSDDYVLVKPVPMNPDHHPGWGLDYRGKEVWPNVYVGSVKIYHDGIFVFSAPVPGSVPNSDGIYTYDYLISPQLFAIQGAGPPVILSQRIIADTLDSKKRYRLRQMTPAESGVRVEFEYSSDTEHQAHMARDVSWTDIQRWLQEADVYAPQGVSHLGVYRVLPIKRDFTGTQATSAGRLVP